MNFIQNESKQKLRGGYYTPLDLSVFLARWVKEINPKKILEPSCGDGIFLSALKEVGGLKNSELTGFELDKQEALKAMARSKHTFPRSKIYAQDFLQWSIEHMGDKKNQFDAVIGNPPFIRYQYLPEEFQTRAEQIFTLLGLPFTKHTNAWVPFVMASMALLRPGGR